MSTVLASSAPVQDDTAGIARRILQATKKRVLVVDDDPMVLTALRRLLDHIEADVETCSDPERAMALFDDGSFDLVISDERMPKMSGLDMLNRVRRTSPRTPTILLTAYNDEDSLKRAYERCGVFRFVTKPWNNVDLIATVREALRAASAIAP